MAFYDLPKSERAERVLAIQEHILKELPKQTLLYFSDEDTYMRKAAYNAIGRIYAKQQALQKNIITHLTTLLTNADFKVRQTAINAAGEIGKKDFSSVQHIFDTGLFDAHSSPRNAVIGSVKKMGEVNPKPVLTWAKQYLHHPDKEIRREICHGIELRGRKYPQDILPLLKELENDKTARVRNTLVHVLGQIAYKKGCLEIVVKHLKTWTNEEVVSAALEEIIDVHDRYKDFAALTQKQAREYIRKNFY